MAEVRLIDYHGSRDLLAYVASVYMNKPDMFNFDRVLKIVGRKEDSILEFGHATFEYRTSLVVRDHLIRYRLASIAAAGLRYNEATAFVLPPEVEDPEEQEVFRRLYESSLEAYRRLRSERVKREAARYLIPAGIEVRYVMQWNFRHLATTFFPQRLWGAGVQAETREVAEKMFRLLEERDPELWQTVRQVYGG